MEPELIVPFAYDLVRLQRRLGWTRARLERHQDRTLADLRAFAVSRSPFYREFHRGREAAPLGELPVLDRSLLLERFDDVTTDRRITRAGVQHHIETAEDGSPFLGRYRVSTSTGSSGGRVTIVLASAREWAFDLASTARTRDLAGMKWSPMRRDSMAMVVSGQRWLASAKAADSLKSRFAPQLFLDARTPLPVLVERLNRYRPDVLSGYGSMIGMLAEEQIAGRLRIAPRLVQTGGEVTLPEGRRRIATAWGEEPFDYYGSAEGGTIAAECRAGRRMHLFEDTTIIEVVDEENRPVPPGTWGAKVLVTPLWLRTQPLIRFELTDVLRVAPDPCVCGRATRVLDGIRGRTSRIFDVPAADGSGTVPMSWMILGIEIAELPATFRAFTIEDGRFVVRLAGLRAGYDLEPFKADVRAEFIRHGATPLPIDIHILPEVPRGPGGKAAIVTPPAGAVPGGG